MKTAFSAKWKKSIQPRKQRKYRYNAPLHIRGKFMNAHLSKELVKKYGTRSVRVRMGDKVKVMRGQFKGTVGKVEKVNLKHEFVYVSKVEITKSDGSKVFYPIHPSNLTILELESDKKRMKRFERIKDTSNDKKSITKNSSSETKSIKAEKKESKQTKGSSEGKK